MKVLGSSNIKYYFGIELKNRVMKKPFDILQILMLALIGIGLIWGIVDLTISLNRGFMYPLGLGVSVFIILGFFELLERAK